MQVHAIQTGSVRVHERQRAGAGGGVLRFGRTLLDRTWTDPLPIYAWVIEHPEGVIVVDTGETARVSEPGYFPRWHPYYRVAVRESVRREEEIGPQLRRLGMTPGDVRWLVMTHLHTDHAGGLHHFPKSEILVSRTEYGAARGLRGKLRGYLPHRWPEWFAPRLVDFDNEPLGPFPRSLRLTRAGDVHLVPTPGHTAGHMSVIVNDGDRVLFLAGDTSYSEENLRRGIVDGVSSLGGGEDAAARTLARIRALAEDVPLVYLPSHEPGAADRLTFKASLAISRRTSVA
ncbi:MAG: N-acyl homoserine lactonase family protein [Gemmatimonadota bacterium]|jgi:N-acyl homoserine lactone hydrolase